VNPRWNANPTGTGRFPAPFEFRLGIGPGLPVFFVELGYEIMFIVVRSFMQKSLEEQFCPFSISIPE
jgi:hypothetical protein